MASVSPARTGSPSRLSTCVTAPPARAVTIASPAGVAATVPCARISEPRPPGCTASTPTAALRIASALIARLSVGVSVVPSAFPALGASAAGSAVQRATEKPPTAASSTAPATPPRRRLSCVIIQHLRISCELAATGCASLLAVTQWLRSAGWPRLSVMTGGCESPRQTPSLAYVHSISRRSLARQGSLGFRPGAARRYEFALGRGIGLLRVEQFDQRGFAGPVGQLREAQGFTRLTDAASFESGDPRLSRAQGRARVGDFSLRVGEQDRKSTRLNSSH